MKSAQERIIRSFPRIVNHNSQILILGTITGEESLRQQQYYAHKQNLFWKFICHIQINLLQRFMKKEDNYYSIII